MDWSVTAPIFVRKVPVFTAPVFTVMDAWARTIPLNTEFTPIVADEPTDQ